MGHFDRGNKRRGYDRGADRGGKSFGGKKFGGKPSFGGGRPSQMHPATCSTCGNDCEVPFRPTGSRPIYCSTCFQKQGNQAPGGRERSFDRPRFDRKPDFHGGNGSSNLGLEELKTQMTQMNAKLDRILDALNSSAPAVPKQLSKLEEMMGIEPAAPKKPVKKAKSKKKK